MPGSGMKSKTSSSSSESYYRAQYENVCKERDALRRTVEAQECEIDELKKSVYELSYMLSMQASSGLPKFSVTPSSADGARSPSTGTDSRTSARAVFDPSFGISGHLDPLRLSMMNEAGMGAGSQGASDRVLVAEAKLVTTGVLLKSGHTAAVYVAKFSPRFSTRGSLVASAGFDRTLRLWEGTYPYSQVACLAAHRQPISDLCWAPDGRSIVSASYDKTVAKWDTETGLRVGKNLALEGLIQCVEMASEGGADGSPGDPVLVGGSSGMSGGGGNLGAGRVAYAGSTSKRIYTVDTRSPMAVVAEWSCDTFVNSLHVYSDGSKVISADAAGKISIWDVRTGGVVDSYSLEAPIHISHIQASPPDAGRPEEEGLYLAANCVDNTLRVFQRRLSFLKDVGVGDEAGVQDVLSSPAAGAGVNASPNGSTPGSVLPSTDASSSSASPAPSSAHSSGSDGVSRSSPVSGRRNANARGVGGEGEGVGGLGGGDVSDSVGGRKDPPLQLISAIRGHTVKNWPIRCSFFRGLHHRPPRMRLGGGKGSDSQLPGVGIVGRGGAEDAGAAGGGGGKNARCLGLGYDGLGKDWQHSLVLATGSADGNIHVFDLSKGEGVEMQTLRGHRDRVYSANFHPTEPKLVSCSADRTVRIWVPNRKRNSWK